MNYGIPYVGSKSGIIDSLALNFPKADNFYDLFGGGFSVTHYMLRNKSHRYKSFFYNEIDARIVELIKSSIKGDFSHDRFMPEWISRDDFVKRINDPYIGLIWSFGNNKKSYLFSKEIEPYKKSMHMAVVFDEFDSLAQDVLRIDSWPKTISSIPNRRRYLRAIIEYYRKTKIPAALKHFLKSKQLESLQRLEQLPRLQRLEQLQQLQQLQQLHFSSLDYRQVNVRPNSIVYCDIPYRNAASYRIPFNYEEFFDWAATRDFPVYISEYSIEDTRFDCIYSLGKTVKLSQKGSSKERSDLSREKLYWNRR